MNIEPLEIERACEVMHDAYERAAKGAGWETNPASRKPWSEVPEANKVTMRAAVAALILHLRAPAQGPIDAVPARRPTVDDLMFIVNQNLFGGEERMRSAFVAYLNGDPKQPQP